MSATPDRILELGFAFWGSKTLLSAVELGVFTVLGDGPLPGETLRQRLALHPRSAHDFFDALVALGMLDRDDRGYANTPATARDQPVSLRVRVASLMFGLKRRSSRQESAKRAGSG